MEGHRNLVGSPRPSAPDQLFASLPITGNLIISRRRIEASSHTVGRSILCGTTAASLQKSEAEWVDGNAGARARHKTATPGFSNLNEWLGRPGAHGRFPRNKQRRGDTHRRGSIGRRIRVTCRTRRDTGAARINHPSCESTVLAHPRRGGFGRKRLDTRGREVSRVSDE